MKPDLLSWKEDRVILPRMTRDVDELLLEAIVNGDDRSSEALAAVGPGAVSGFRDWLAGITRIALPAGRDRELIDNMTGLSCFLAARFPDEYVAAFNSPRWMSSSAVLTGLGYTGLSEVAATLIDAPSGTEPGVTRCSAARALAAFPSERTIAALCDAVDDPDTLVRYHAIQSLGAIGDERAMERVLPLANDPGVGALAARTVQRITERLSLRREGS